MRINFQIANPPLFTKSRFDKSDRTLSYASNPLKPLQKDVFEKTVPSSNNISFEGTKCDTSDFEIKRIENVRCPVCEKITMNFDDIDEFVYLLCGKKGQELIDAFDTYGKESYWKPDSKTPDRSIYRPQKQEIIDEIKKTAKEYPDLGLEEIVQLRVASSLPSLVEKQIKVIDELIEYANKNITEPDEFKRVNGTAQSYKKALEQNGKFKRKNFINAFGDVSSDKKIQEDINSITKKMPTSDESIDAFFVKYSKRDEKETLKRLVRQNIPTADHLICHSPDYGGGKDEIENYLCECAECNETRATTPFDEWSQSIPDFKEKLERHLNEIQKEIYKGNLSPVYDSYPLILKKTVSELSDSKIVLKLPHVNKSKLEDLIASREEELNKVLTDIQDKLEYRRSLQRQYERARQNSNYNAKSLKYKLDKVNREVDELYDKKRELKAALQYDRRVKEKIFCESF